MLQRFLQLKYHVDVRHYDFIIRVNISTYINIKRLKNEIHTFPKQHFFAGYLFQNPMPLYEEYKNSPFIFVSGTCTILSRDVYDGLAYIDIHDRRLYTANDDVAMSYIIKKFVSSFTHIPMALVENDAMPPLNNALLYRIKHYQSRDKEVNHWKFLLNKYDSLTD